MMTVYETPYSFVRTFVRCGIIVRTVRRTCTIIIININCGACNVPMTVAHWALIVNHGCCACARVHYNKILICATGSRVIISPATCQNTRV